MCGRCIWEPSGQCGHSDLVGHVCTSDIAAGDILNEHGVDIGVLDDTLQELQQQVLERCILERTLTTLRKGCTGRISDDDIIWVLGQPVFGATVRSRTANESGQNI